VVYTATQRPWKQARALEIAATVAPIHSENTALRQRVAELERLVGALKGRLLADGLALVQPRALTTRKPLRRQAPAPPFFPRRWRFSSLPVEGP
jgi:hypothetical protein